MVDLTTSRDAAPSGGGASHELTLLAGPGLVEAGSRWASGIAATYGMHGDDEVRVGLGVRELLARLAAHGESGPVPLLARLFLTIGETITFLEVRDGGAPFDPTQAGVGSGHELADAVEYAREHDENVVRLTFQHSRLAPLDRVARGVERRAPDLGPVVFPLRRADGTIVNQDLRRGMDRRLLGFISSFAMFRGVPYADMEALVADCPVREVPDGEVLLQPGEPSQHLLVVITGRLRVHLDTPGSADFVPVAVGECFGEIPLIDRTPVAAYVVADAGCRLLVIDEATFLDRVLAVPRVAGNLLSVLAERMRQGTVRELVRLRAVLALERIQREMRFARDIQANLLPSQLPLLADHVDVDCDGRTRAARDVGGDFFDVFFLDPRHLFFAVGDVRAQGMAAALFMVRSLTVLRAAAEPDLARAMERFNALLFAGNESGLFATMFCGILDTESGDLTWVDAGHPAALLAQPEGGFAPLEGPRNVLVGVAPDARYEAGSAVLQPGGVLLVYTDGVTGAESPRGETFGEARLGALLDRAADRSANALVEATFAAVDAFAAGRDQADDITVLAVRWAGATSAPAEGAR